jgi:Trypsin-co-occurring domain 1
MELQSRIISVELADGTSVKIEVTPIGDRKINFHTRPFKEVTDTIESLSKEIAEALYKVKADRFTVKFGIEVGIESGKLTALLVKGISTANLEITLEWGQ